MEKKYVTLEFLQNVISKEYPGVVLYEIDEEPGAKRGDNYISMVFRVALSGVRTRNDGDDIVTEPWSSSIIYKCLPESKQRREAYKSDILFSNEAAFYTKIIPKLLEYQRQFTIKNPFKAVPKCLLAAEDLIILEDLRCSGFKMLDRRVGLTAEQCYAALKELAYFHALSFALKYENPEEFEELKDCISEGLFRVEYEEWYRSYYASAAKNAHDMVKCELVGKPNADHYMEKFDAFLDGDNGVFMKLVELVTPKEPFSVICHGDCWTNNIMYKYNDCSKIDEVCFLDFQIARYCSPAVDLAYIIYLCTSREQRDQYLNNILIYYNDNLYTRILELSTARSKFSEQWNKDQFLEMLKSEFNRCGQFGLGLALDMLPIMTCDSNEAPDIYEAKSEAGTSVTREENKPPLTNNSMCRKRMTDLVCELVDRNII